MLNSGTGEFGHVDLASGRFEPIAFCPGYLRGLTFHDGGGFRLWFRGGGGGEMLTVVGHHATAVVVVSGRDIPVDIELRTGSYSEWLRINGTLVTELYDSVVLPGVRQPMAVGFKTTEIDRLMLIELKGHLCRPAASGLTCW